LCKFFWEYDIIAGIVKGIGVNRFGLENEIGFNVSGNVSGNVTHYRHFNPNQ